MSNIAQCKTNNVEEVLKHYEKLFYKYQYENTNLFRLSENERHEVNELKSKIDLLNLLLKNNIHYLSDVHHILIQRLRSSL